MEETKEHPGMKRSPRRMNIQVKLNLLVICSIMLLAAGLTLISYYVFCQNVDDKYTDRLQNAAIACANNVDPEMLEHFWLCVNTDEFREVRDRAEAAGDQQLLEVWLRSQPGQYDMEFQNIPENQVAEASNPNGWSLMNDYEQILMSLEAINDYLETDSAYYQYNDGNVTYNIADPQENLFYIATVEEPVEAFAPYPGNVAVPPIKYHSGFGWLFTAMQPIIDPESGEAVAVAGVDVNMTDIMRERYSFLKQSLIFVALLLFVVILSSMLLIKRTTVRPLQQLAKAAAGFASGDRAFTKDDVIELDIRNNDEVGDLYHEIRSMENRIVDYTEHLMKVTAEKERVGTELRTASRIQESMLPSVFPAFPDIDSFDLYASMTPAKEVGGDFYDFFLLDDTHLAVLIADVSDKGVPAALFMMASMIILNYRAQMGGSPSEILNAVNAQICKGNKSKMFVTVWLGILDLNTGILTASNAGHEYPCVRGQDGVFHVLKDRHGLVVGAMAKSKYTDYEIRMEPGDAVFVYTDGVPEANNADGAFYGMERMENTLNRLSGQDPKGVLEGIKADVDAFTGDANQFDDMTMLCLEYRGQVSAS